MAARYQVILKNQAGVQVALLTDWRRLTIERRVNGVDSHNLQIDGELAVVDLFALDGQIEVWRRDVAASPALAWYREYEGFHRTDVRQTLADGLSLYDSYGFGYDHLLERRMILYPSGSAQVSKSGPGETVIKEYVDENAGPSATSPPRLQSSGVFPGLTIQAGGAAGNAWTGSRAYKALLDVCQELANATLVDFGIVGTGAATFEFQAKAAPWGTDRTVGNPGGNPAVIFSLGFGNMEQPRYSMDRRHEINVVLILGQGIEADRAVVERTDAVAITESPWNRIELGRNATFETTTSGLETVGDAILEDDQARETFTFDVLPTPASIYGRDYFLGDLVTARYKDIERNKKIIGVKIMVDAKRGERISLEFGDVS